MGFLTSRQYASSRLVLLVLIYIACNVVVFIYKKATMVDSVVKRGDSGHDHLDFNASTVGSKTSHPSSTSIQTFTEGPRKRILFWNPFFKSDDYKFGVGHQPFLDNMCPIDNCETYTDRSTIKTADAVVFHGPRVEDFPPKVRPPGQKYVYIQEKPNYNPSVAFMSDFDGHMNLTITNRLDSDIEFPHALIHYDSSSLRKKRYPVDPSQRPRSIVWVVHRCATPSRREWYVKELKKYIDIDVYGECGDKKCKEEEGEEDQECLDFFQKKYLFYLALEYDVCRDYVSEKIYKAFKKQIIPIVFGGANYSYVAPPKSVIDIKDYPHPQKLAEYLRHLSSDSHAYNAYFEWKNNGYYTETGREVIMGNNFCQLCAILNNDGYPYKTYRKLKDWWLEGICDASVIPRMRRTEEW